MESQGTLGLKEDAGVPGVLVPSPQSEAVTHELEELSLTASQNLPPLNERKNVLQLRLQQRRTREQLVEQGIMAPLKSPAAFHEQIRSLERARTENFLKHKISSRPERSELVRMHILQETLAEPSLQATQLRLKRARLADDLNEKIAQRPGPMELVEKNILPVDSSLKEAIIEIGEMNYPKTRDVYAFDEDSGDALSPGLPASQESQGSVASPGELKIPEASSPQTISTLQFYPPISQPTAEYLKAVSTNEQPVSRMSPVSQPVATAAPSKPGPTLVKQSQPKQPGDKSRSKKGKEAKPRVKKLKYHQYIPPDQKQEPTEAPMDSSYARLLQQQQLFLQLQILSQQQQHYNYQTILPASLKQVTDGQNSSSSVALNNNSGLSPSVVVSLPTAATSRPNHTLTNRKPGLLPSNLDEMKVAELKTELKIRGLPVSGTKTDLIERLRPYQEVSTNASSTPPNAGLADKQHFSPSQQGAPEIMSSTPPVSPGASDLSNLSTEEMATADCPSEGLKPPPGSTPRGSALEEGASETRARDKDLRLHEKERQIKELTRKLEQEQRLVEALKMQLEVEKRSQQGGQPSEPSTPAPVKVENGGSANCSAAQPATVKQEQPLPRAQTATLPQFFISREQATQVLRQPQILLPVSHPANLATIQLPSNSLGLQTQSVLQASVPTQAPGLAQTSGPRVQLQKTETSAVPPPTQTQHVTQTFPVCTTSNPAFQYSPNLSQTAMEIPQSFLNSSPESRSPARTSPSHAVLNGPTNKPPSPSQPTFILQQSTFTNHTPKSKDPPRYEEAVKQTRSLQTPRQVPTATSQQMDDLFDILIESGEISPFIRQDPPSSAKTLTANITTLPISTALSRPPPQVQVAPRPAPILVALASDNQLEAFLEGALAGGGEPRTLRVMEELNCQLLDQPNSPMDTSDLSFTDGSPPSAFHLSDTNLDNMEWLDLTIPGPAEGLNQLGVPPAGGVFSTDFLDAHDLQLHWD